MKDRSILALKGLAIIGVVYHHIANRRFDAQVSHWADGMSLVFHWCVLAFIAVSGYLQAMSDSRKQRTLLEFTKSRFFRLLVPFFLLVVFYSCIWQILQACHVPNIAIKIPPGFFQKLQSALWPVDSQVADQLYFFPLLFGITMVLVIVQKVFRIYGMWAAAVIASVPGLIYYPTEFTGFHIGVFIWGIVFYAAGYLLFHYRDRKTAIRVALLIVTVIFIAGNGGMGILRCVPLWLLAEAATLRLDHSLLLVKLGDASGTIYAYHTPFLMRPLVIATAFLPGDALQLIAIHVDVWIAIGLCYVLFECLKNTRAKVILM